MTSHRVILRLTAGPTKGREFVFDAHDTFLFGRAPDCHVSIPDDAFVSRHHFLLEVAPPEVRLRDLGSLNGTAVNGRVLGGRQGQSAPPPAAAANQVNLRNGDTVQVGQTSFEVIVEPLPRSSTTGTLDSEEKSTVKGTAPFEAPEGYAIDRELGRGAASVVYLATRLADDALVAIKFVPVADETSPDARRLFLREIETVRVLKHPNIVAFNECGATRSVLYLAMEYCDQGSVSAFMTRRGGKLSIHLSVSIALHALRGLHYAHTRGVVHRDLKPENILLHEKNQRWTAKIGDFGLAKCLDLAGLSGLTATGDFGGTLPFMPREQLTHYRHVGPASDVWGMGATLYHMITGKYPRRGRAGQDALDIVLNGEQVAIENCGIVVPSAVAEVIGKALEPESGKRFTNAGEFHAALKMAVSKPVPPDVFKES